MISSGTGLCQPLLGIHLLPRIRQILGTHLCPHTRLLLGILGIQMARSPLNQGMRHMRRALISNLLFHLHLCPRNNLCPRNLHTCLLARFRQLNKQGCMRLLHNRYVWARAAWWTKLPCHHGWLEPRHKASHKASHLVCRPGHSWTSKRYRSGYASNQKSARVQRWLVG